MYLSRTLMVHTTATFVPRVIVAISYSQKAIGTHSANRHISLLRRTNPWRERFNFRTICPLLGDFNLRNPYIVSRGNSLLLKNTILIYFSVIPISHTGGVSLQTCLPPCFAISYYFAFCYIAKVVFISFSLETSDSRIKTDC